MRLGKSMGSTRRLVVSEHRGWPRGCALARNYSNIVCQMRAGDDGSTMEEIQNRPKAQQQHYHSAL